MAPHDKNYTLLLPFELTGLGLGWPVRQGQSWSFILRCGAMCRGLYDVACTGIFGGRYILTGAKC